MTCCGAAMNAFEHRHGDLNDDPGRGLPPDGSFGE
jgi:hypothetical protein